jgi:hypothetical protein
MTITTTSTSTHCDTDNVSSAPTNDPYYAKYQIDGDYNAYLLSYYGSSEAVAAATSFNNTSEYQDYSNIQEQLASGAIDYPTYLEGYEQYITDYNNYYGNTCTITVVETTPETITTGPDGTGCVDTPILYKDILPVAYSDGYTIVEGNKSVFDVIANDALGNETTSVVSTSALVINGKSYPLSIIDGKVVFDGNVDVPAGQTYVGTFTYTIQDADCDQSSASVTVCIVGKPEDKLPDAINDSYGTYDEGASITFNVMAQ